MFKQVIIAFRITIFVTAFVLSLQGGQSVASEMRFGAINVPASMVWVQPGQLRDYDSQILSENNNPRAWADGMNSTMRQWLVGKVETMLLLGEQVVILEQRGDWVKIAAVNHRTEKNSSGYPGWIPSHHVITNDTFLSNIRSAPLVTVHKPFSFIYSDISLTKKIHEITYMVTLPQIAENKHVVTVSLPDGNVGYISVTDVKKTNELSFSKTGILEEAMKFQGVRYIWGGTTAYGYDCSGFTLRLYQSQGINIPRDASEQFNEGVPTHKNDLLPGDLVFFHNGSRIYHVGMYIGNGKMIHAPNSSSEVKIDSISEGNYANNYWGARRYAQEPVETIHPPTSNSDSVPKESPTKPSPIEENVSDKQPSTGTDRKETNNPASEDALAKSDTEIVTNEITIAKETIDSNAEQIEMLATANDTEKPIGSTKKVQSIIIAATATLLLLIAIRRKIR
jgi:cell wall-associated NlpC family hydrolase